MSGAGSEKRLAGPAELLSEAGQHLARVEALIGTAAEQLGEPFASPLRIHAADAAGLRRRLRNAATAVGATIK